MRGKLHHSSPALVRAAHGSAAVTSHPSAGAPPVADFCRLPECLTSHPATLSGLPETLFANPGTLSFNLGALSLNLGALSTHPAALSRNLETLSRPPETLSGHLFALSHVLFNPNSEVERGSHAPRVLLSAPSRKTRAHQNYPCVCAGFARHRAGCEGASSHTRGRVCSPTSEVGLKLNGLYNPLFYRQLHKMPPAQPKTHHERPHPAPARPGPQAQTRPP